MCFTIFKYVDICLFILEYSLVRHIIYIPKKYVCVYIICVWLYSNIIKNCKDIMCLYYVFILYVFDYIQI